MDRDNANATRLRVNRIALIQQVDSQELIPKLIRAHIISADHDVQYINQGTSRIDRARRLIDCLLRQDSQLVDRPANWFTLFRNILLENPSIYGDLVTALDNTVIRKPDATDVQSSQISNSNSNNLDSFRQTQQNRNVQNQIKNVEFDRYAMNRAIVEGSFQKVIDNLTYHSQVCIMLGE